MSIDADRGIPFRTPPDSGAQIDLVPPDEAYELIAPVYERVRRETPGFFARTEAWWRNFKLFDPERWRRGAGPLFVAVLEFDGEVEGYARYAIKDKWTDGLPDGELYVREALGSSPRATREVWRFLFGVDLVTRVKAWHLAADHELFHLTYDFRRLRTHVGDGLYLRLVDVAVALGARSYANDDRLVVELRDEFCPWNAGRWAIGPDGVERTRVAAELELGAEELGAAYLGGTTFGELARAERVVERKPGALSRADVLFRTNRAPWCPEVF
jgi:predicted acetyltransferase